MRLPNIQLIGVQKAGTSTLAEWLFEEGVNRPTVFENDPYYYSKEVHFFDIDHRYCQGIDFYAKRFANETIESSTSEASCSGRNLRMDATPDTFQVADRVWKTYHQAGEVEELKILVILREPVSRELSLYNHLAYDCRRLADTPEELSSWHRQVLDDGSRILSFDQFVHRVSMPALLHGEEEGGRTGRSTRHALYATHLSTWFQLFNRKQILVLSYDELQKNPQTLQSRVKGFLSLDNDDIVNKPLTRSNTCDSKHKVQTPSLKATASLQAIFTTHNANLYQLLASEEGPPMEQKPFPTFELS